MKLVILPGDGIGPEITAATTAVLGAASQAFQLGLEMEHDVVGLDSFQRFGTTVKPELLDRVKAADGFVMGPTSTLGARPGNRILDCRGW